jgi:hypothetical protein
MPFIFPFKLQSKREPSGLFDTLHATAKSLGGRWRETTEAGLFVRFAAVIDNRKVTESKGRWMLCAA